MMLTMAMPPMKRSDLIMALVPLRLPSPMVPKNTDGSLCGFLKISGSDPETREPPFPAAPARPGGSPWARSRGILRPAALCALSMVAVPMSPRSTDGRDADLIYSFEYQAPISKIGVSRFEACHSCQSQLLLLCIASYSAFGSLDWAVYL
jgi:hypothetical protein